MGQESRNKKPKLPTALEIEQDARIKKLEESCKMQTEIHEEKLKVIQKEAQYWAKMEETVELKKIVYTTEIKAMEAQIKYWDAKYLAHNPTLDS